MIARVRPSPAPENIERGKAMGLDSPLKLREPPLICKCSGRRLSGRGK